MNDKPSDIHKKSSSKLTRRRLMKMSSALGFSGATALNLTPEDVKAADSDQVPIALGYSSDTKVMVDADWYDRLIIARRQLQKLSEGWLEGTNSRATRDEHDDVHSVWLDAGKGGKLPSLIMSVDKESPTKNETRGNIPEFSNGIEVEVEETPRRVQETTHADEDPHPLEPCGPHGCEHYPKSDKSELPGGLKVEFYGSELTTTATLSPRTYYTGTSPDLYYCFTTAAHAPAKAEDACGSDLIGLTANHDGIPIGDIVMVDHDYDIAVIFDDVINDRPQGKVVNPAAHSEQYRIKDTLNEDGVDHFINNSDDDSVYVEKHGVGSCKSSGDVHSRGNTELQSFPFYEGDPCVNTWTETVRWGDFCDLYPSDSGSIAFGPDPYGDDYFGVCQNSWRFPGILGGYSGGPAGYALQNNFGVWWRD